MIQPTPRNSFSAPTELWLMVDGRRVELGQIGPDFIMSQAEGKLPPGSCGELHATVGDEETIWPIVLPDGLGQDGKREARMQEISIADLA